MIFFDSIRKALSEVMASHLPNEWAFQDLYSLWTPTPSEYEGDYSLPCFTLAKAFKKAPPLIAKELVAKLQADLPSSLTKAEAVGPYVNLTLTPAFLGVGLAQVVEGRFFQKPLKENPPKTMIEFSQPNTHKELHVGHMRNLCLGDALVRLHRYCGYEVIAATFPGDMGTHVAKCLWYLKNHETSSPPEKRKGSWLGELYTKSYHKLENERGTPQEEKNRETLTEILRQIEEQDGEYYQLWQETRAWSLELMKSVYQWAEVTFDQWYFESEVDAASLELVKKYSEQGLFIKSEGAIGIDLEKEKLGFCLLLKRDGRGLYATKDLELARRKFEDFNVEKSLYVVDKRQELHFKQVFKTLEKMGFEQAKNCVHLKYDFVELPNGAMSSRQGNIVPLEELVQQMERKIKTDYLSRYQDQWSQEDIQNVAHQVAQGAIKYGMTSVDTQRKIVFDMQEWLRLDGESGPYIQYVHARICSLLDKLSFNKKDIHWDVLTQPKEHQLMVKLLRFNTVVFQACEQQKPHLLTSYLYETAKLFNAFYTESPIMKASTPEQQQSRATLALATQQVLKQGLELLGIPAPEKM